MSDDANALLALKNAWKGAVSASEPVRALEPAVGALAAELPLNELDLDTYARLTAAQANAVEALRGLVEQLARRRAGGDANPGSHA
jgi:hypothetical protein